MIAADSSCLLALHWPIFGGAAADDADDAAVVVVVVVGPGDLIADGP